MKKSPLLCLALILLCTACSSERPRTWEDWRAAGDRLEEETRNKRVARTWEDFVASEGYRTSRDMWCGGALQGYDPAHTHVEILLNEQRGRLYINGAIAMDFPICSGRFGGSETPKGTFRISQMEKEYRSSLYGAYVNDQDIIVQGGADSRIKGPAGTHFKGAKMPYWMRFNGAIGMHVGNVYREGKSHGCVRIPVEACSIVFSKVAVGSKVIVK